MLSVAQTQDAENSRLAQEYEDYRKACRERYMQQAAIAPIQEEKEHNDSLQEEVANVTDALQQASVSEATDGSNIASITETPLDASPLTTSRGVDSPLSTSRGVDSPLSTSRGVENLKKSGQTERRNSLSKVISFFSKKSNSPAMGRDKKKLTKEEKEKAEQDWRMARFIAELEFEGRSDQEIQMHLFHLRDQAQFGRPRSNSVGDWFKSMHQAFKDEFSTRRDVATVHVSAANPFSAAPSANFANDIGYTYEDLVALENVPRGAKCLDHLPVLTYEGQELPSDQSTCAVCMMEFEKSEELRGLHCTHHFHKECIDKWLAVGSTCPVCKTDVESDPLTL